MILPIGDSPNPDGTPVVTYFLIGANVAVYLLTLPLTWTHADPSDPLLIEFIHLVARQHGYQSSIQDILAHTSAYDLFVFRWGYRPVAPSIVDLFASMFLHAGFGHLAGNMLFLWIYGDNVEHRLGKGRYLFYYLATGAAATIFHGMFSPNSGLPLVGASGAISGILGFYFVWFPRNRVHLLLLFPFLLRVVVSARSLLGLYIIVQNVLPFILSRASGGVAHGAHIGGFFAGVAVAYWFDRGEALARPAEYATAAPQGHSISTAIADGQLARAAREYFALAPEQTRKVLQPEEMIRLGNWLLDSGDPGAALVVFRRHLRDYPGGPLVGEAHVGAGNVLLRSLGQETAAYQHFLDALDSDLSPAAEAAARRALSSISDRQSRIKPLYTPHS